MALPGNAMDGSEPSRILVKRKRITGRVQEWKGHYGWIIPDRNIEHAEAALNHGRIYVSRHDIDAGSRTPPSLMPGDIVQFLVYADGRGLGAVQCRLQEVVERETKRPRLQDKAEVVKVKTAARAMNNFTNDGSFLEQCKQLQREGQMQQVQSVRPVQWLRPPSTDSAAPRPVAARPVIIPSIRPLLQSPGHVTVDGRAGTARPAGRLVPPRIIRGSSGQPPAASSSATSSQPPVRLLRPLRPVAVRLGAATPGDPHQGVNGDAAASAARGQTHGRYARHGGRAADLGSTSAAGRTGFQEHHRSGNDPFDPFEQDEEDPFGTL